MNWQKFKLGFWSVFWGAIGGAIVIAVIGFKWGGWVTSGTAHLKPPSSCRQCNFLCYSFVPSGSLSFAAKSRSPVARVVNTR